MNTTIESVTGAIVCLVAVATFYLGIRSSARKQTAKEATDREEIRDKAFREGAASRNPDVALLTSQRDDARRDRDLNQAQANEFARRYNDLRDRGAK